MRETRKPCREGHYDCIGYASRDDRCKWDPSRCEGKGGRHVYDLQYDAAGREVCIRCMRPTTR